MLILYGIKNCDTCRKASKWLENNRFDFIFHDFRKDGLDKNVLNSWSDLIDLELCLNRKSASWRKLSEAERNKATNDVAKIFLQYPTLIKRPVLRGKYSIILGFHPEEYRKTLK